MKRKNCFKNFAYVPKTKIHFNIIFSHIDWRYKNIIIFLSFNESEMFKTIGAFA